MMSIYPKSCIWGENGKEGRGGREGRMGGKWKMGGSEGEKRGIGEENER